MSVLVFSNTSVRAHVLPLNIFYVQITVRHDLMPFGAGQRLVVRPEPLDVGLGLAIGSAKDAGRAADTLQSGACPHEYSGDDRVCRETERERVRVREEGNEC